MAEQYKKPYICIAYPPVVWQVVFVPDTTFEWDSEKDRENRQRHGVPFELAQYAFADPSRVIAQDVSHSQQENRFFCFGRVGSGILTVRFTYRDGAIRIFGAGYWRKGKKIYEQENRIR